MKNLDNFSLELLDGYDIEHFKYNKESTDLMENSPGVILGMEKLLDKGFSFEKIIELQRSIDNKLKERKLLIDKMIDAMIPEEIANINLLLAKETSAKYDKIINNAINKAISLDDSARDLGYNLRYIERNSSLSRLTVDSIFQAKLTKAILDNSKKSCFKIDLLDIAKVATVGFVTGGASKSASNFIFSNKGGKLLNAIEGAASATVFELLGQCSEFGKCRTEKKIKDQKLKNLYNDIDEKRARIREKVALVLINELKKANETFKKEFKKDISAKKEANIIREKIREKDKHIKSYIKQLMITAYKNQNKANHSSKNTYKNW